jgi:hypothetical protein
MIVDPVGRVLAQSATDRDVQVRRIDLDYRVLHSNCMWEWSLKDHPEYEGRVSISWDRDAHDYLATSLDPKLPVEAFLEREGLLTGRQRMGKNIGLLDRAWGAPPPSRGVSAGADLTEAPSPRPGSSDQHLVPGTLPLARSAQGPVHPHIRAADCNLGVR